MPSPSPLTFWNSKGELLNISNVDVKGNNDESSIILDVKHDDRNTPITMKLSLPVTTGNRMKCLECGETKEDNLQWKALYLKVIARDVRSLPSSFPIEILQSDSYIIEPSVLHSKEFLTSEELVIQFRDAPPTFLSKEINMPICFRERCFRIQATVEVQCRRCHVSWLAWHVIINTYDPQTFLNWQVTLSLRTITSPPILCDLSQTFKDEDQIKMLVRRLSLPSTVPLVGFHLTMTISVNPVSIPMTLSDAIPLYFWIDSHFNAMHAHQFTILNINPPSWKPTSDNPQVEVTLTVGIKPSISHEDVVTFLKTLLENKERKFTIQIEGPIHVSPQRILTPVDVIINPQILEELLNRMKMPIHWNEIQQAIIGELNSYLDRILQQKLQKSSWRQLLPIHELLEVKTVLKDDMTLSEEDDKRFPFIQLLEHLDFHRGNVHDGAAPTTTDGVVSQSRHRHRKIIVNGLPGIGKTSCAVQLVKTLLGSMSTTEKESKKQEASGHTIPLYLELGRTEHQDVLKDAFSISDPSERWFKTIITYLQKINAPNRLLDELNIMKASLERESRQLCPPSLVWFLDGWNESSPEFRREIIACLEATDDPFILFTRPGAIPDRLNRRADVLHVTVEPLSISRDENRNTAFQLAWNVMKDAYDFTLRATHGHRHPSDENQLRTLAWNLVKGLANTLGNEVLIPFFLILLSSKVTREWIARGRPRDDSTLLDPYFKSRHDLLFSTFQALLHRHLESTFLHPILEKLPKELRESTLEVALYNVMSKFLVEFLASVIHSLYLQNRTTKGTWFTMDAINKAFRDAANEILINGTKIVRCDSDGWKIVLKVEITPYYPFDDSIKLTFSMSPSQASSQYISESFFFKIMSCVLDVLFPRIQRILNHQSSLSTKHVDDNFVTRLMTEHQSIQAGILPTLHEEREILHELLADFFLAHAITMLWKQRKYDDETRCPMSDPEIAEAYLTWMENEQFDEVWRQIFSSDPFSSDLNEIKRFLVECIRHVSTMDEKTKNHNIQALSMIFSILRKKHQPFIISKNKNIKMVLIWRWSIEKTFRVRLSPRGIQRIQFNSIRDGDQWLSMLSEKLTQISSLVSLELTENDLTSLPDNFFHLSNLQHLNLGHNKLTNLPMIFGNLTRLQTLYLHRNQLESLPESFGHLSDLLHLNIENNQLRTLPESFGKLHNLRELFLVNNQLQELPESFGHLHSLQKLFLRDNQLRTLPESFWQLHNLRELSLWNNQLQSLPERIGQLQQLQRLRLQGNPLQSLPENIGQLKRLRELALRWCQLRTLPESIGKLKNLKTLDLASNQLQSLPESIGKLKNLKTLDLASNQLQSLPESIGKLHDLQNLNLSSTSLKSLPENITTLIHLTYLDLRNNPNLNLSQRQERWVSELQKKGCTVLR